jgi:2-aminoethylphosphonate-pyruvate transaminase
VSGARNGPWLFTPGPVNTSEATKRAMLRDLGSRDKDFAEITARVCAHLLDVAGATQTHVCVPVQGSGTFAVEAALGSLIPREGKVLVLVNGVYGRRMADICTIIGHDVTVLETDEHVPPTPEEVAAALAAQPRVTHVAAVHCETTSGILNPIEEIAAAVTGAGRRLLIDAMSSFGLLPLEPDRLGLDAVMASSNKCLEGVPGLAFVITPKEVLERCAGNARSLSLDLHDQWRFMERTGQWRFTPPTHVVAALDKALADYFEEGGREARYARYRRNCEVLVAAMRGLGFHTLLPDSLQAPVIVTFLAPADPNFEFESFYERLRRRGLVIYPGKLASADSFRVGCIGRLGEAEMRGLVAAVAEVVAEMGVGSCAPAGGGGAGGEA